MNPQHAQAFRELRDWCEKYDAKILAWSDDVVRFLFDGNIRDCYEAASFSKDAASVRFLTLQKIDPEDK